MQNSQCRSLRPGQNRSSRKRRILEEHAKEGAICLHEFCKKKLIENVSCFSFVATSCVFSSCTTSAPFAVAKASIFLPALTKPARNCYFHVGFMYATVTSFLKIDGVFSTLCAWNMLQSLCSILKSGISFMRGIARTEILNDSFHRHF